MDYSLHKKPNEWQDISEVNVICHERCARIVEVTRPERLARYLDSLPEGRGSHVSNLVIYGGCNFMRLITLSDGRQCLARFRFYQDVEDEQQASDILEAGDAVMQREVDTLWLVARNSLVPVPRVIAYGTSQDMFDTPFIIMEYISAKGPLDYHWQPIPHSVKPQFYKQLASAQVQIANLTFPKIGTLILADDGSISIGPIPGIGGPFSTATEFIQAWAKNAEFSMSETAVRQGCGPFAEEVWYGIQTFPTDLHRLADRICTKNNHGPFPLLSTDFGHHNMVLDAEYNIKAVVDWERAYTAPWETIDFPTTLWVTPQPLDPPFLYDESGWPKDEELQGKYCDRQLYLEAVKEFEREIGSDSKLSQILADTKLQNVATSMVYFKRNSKLGLYARVLDPFRE